MTATLRIGGLALGDRARIAVPFAGPADAAQVADLRGRGMDVAELRFDLFADGALDAWRAALAAFAGMPVLATIRSASEGGGWKGDEAERLGRYRALLPHVSAVDVEIESDISRDVVGEARDAGRLAIASFHDFAKTPPAAELAERIAAGRALGADVVKLAAAAHGVADLRSLARVLVERDDVGMVVIAMGDAGAASRVLFPALGSLLTYASVDAVTAPGQLALDELVALLARLAPTVRR